MGSNYAELHLISALHYLTMPLSGPVVSRSRPKLASFEFRIGNFFFFFTITLKVSVGRKKKKILDSKEAYFFFLAREDPVFLVPLV